MAICANCGERLACGCQRRTASDGTQCCDECIKIYEERLKNVNINNDGKK